MKFLIENSRQGGQVPNPVATAECIGMPQNKIRRWADCFTAISTVSLAKSSKALNRGSETPFEQTLLFSFLGDSSI